VTCDGDLLRSCRIIACVGLAVQEEFVTEGFFLRTPRVNACVLMSESELEATHPAHELVDGPAARCLCVDYGNQIVRCRELEDRSCLVLSPKIFGPAYAGRPEPNR